MEKYDDLKTYLSTSGGKWRIIHQGMPLCRDTDRTTAEKYTAQLKIKLPAFIWNGDSGHWVHADSFDEEVVK